MRLAPTTSICSIFFAMVVVMPAAVPNILAQAGRPQSETLQQAPDVSKDAPSIEFDVVSVKPFKTDGAPHWIGLTPDGISIQGMPLQTLLQAAFGVEKDRILGVPAWGRTDEFDVVAKVAGPDLPLWKKQTFNQRGIQLRPILEDRFRLKYHYETRVLPFYALTLVKGGAKMKVFEPPGDDASNGLRLVGRGHLQAQGILIDSLCRELAQQLSATVLNKTGLTGRFDFTLLWEPDDVLPGGMGVNDNGAPSDSGASLFTALKEQLGLKLESQKGPVSVIVIDHVEGPSSN